MPALLTSMSIPQKQRRRCHTDPPASGDVHANADNAVRIAEFGRRSSSTRLIKISDDNFGAVDPESARNFPTYAARRAGNDGNLAFEIHPKFLSFVLRD
jgi:hypothetical protein